MSEVRKVPVQVKPHIYHTYYPKLERGFWRVSEMPRPFTRQTMYLWGMAHLYVYNLNSGYSQ